MSFLKSIICNLLILLVITFSISGFLYVLSETTSCFKDKKKAVFDNYTPLCTISGNYLPYQKWNSLSYSWCVTSDGIIIPGTYKKINVKTSEKSNYYKNLRFNECMNIRKNMNISQRVIVIMGKIFNPYVS